ncbi:MAG: DegT/DnrJ/EryC1/StrS family aminotransferase, partial [Clostridiales bacterium]|nr:DegT/DnrJ/EryC1/StrS family aminotransferase [Clostridiales bacterium]
MPDLKDLIPVNEPLIGRNALAYVTQCLETGWISSAGGFIRRFEQEFARYLSIKHAITTTSGTTALHLAMASLGLGPG